MHSYRVTKANISNTNIKRLLSNKIIVLNTVISQNKNSCILLKSCLDKRSEYNISLGHYHSTNREYPSSRKYYWRAFYD